MLYTHSFPRTKVFVVLLLNQNPLVMSNYRNTVGNICTLSKPLRNYPLQKSLVFPPFIQIPSVLPSVKTHNRSPWYFSHTFRTPQSLPNTEFPGTSCTQSEPLNHYPLQKSLVFPRLMTSASHFLRFWWDFLLDRSWTKIIPKNCPEEKYLIIWAKNIQNKFQIYNFT